MSSSWARTGKNWWEWGFLFLKSASCLWQVAGFAQVLIDTNGLCDLGHNMSPPDRLFLLLPPPYCRPLLLPVAPMAEEWLDCPALGPGWKRREVFRKSGATCGRSDTYYQSPTGDRIRSKVELIRYLGPSCDLSLFDFKQGILCYPAPKVQNLALPGRKRKKPSKPVKARKCQVGPKRVEVRKEAPGAKTKADADTAPASLPAPGHCENCGISFSGDGTGRQRLKTLCKDCRAQRIAFNREQRMFKRVGCGECAACRVTEDCGACSTCLLQLPHDVASGLFCKCERRRCLRIVEKGKHSRRRGGCDSKMAARRRSRTQPLPPLPPPQPPKTPALQPYTNRRQNRKCGACAACQRRMDCGHCDFCCDKPKFGGSNQKRQKCRWRQCLQFAMKRLLPNVWSGSEDGAASPPPIPRRKRPGSTRRPRVGHSLKTPSVTPTVRTNQAQTPVKQETGNGFVLPPPGTDLVFLREGASSPVQPCSRKLGPSLLQSSFTQRAQCPGLSWVVVLSQVKQEKVDAQEDWTPGRAILTSPVSLRGCPSKAVDSGLPVVKQEPPDSEEEKEKSKDDSASDSAPKEQARGAGTPVITEIFSLGGTRLRDTAVWLPSLQGRQSGREDGCKCGRPRTHWRPQAQAGPPLQMAWNPCHSPPPTSMMWVSCRRNWCPSPQS
ncbi:methyl-CpG-binding domain protein 1 isoform X18 [Pipistrellus kuhlii]|uniref:methyl-CpG-binding domain protein 1 isoform X18 n=1 Tax=Pipistrellus kuhlii TaxID=59472 RepID=UPI001E274C7D|nr:methyl-CpG-binding domain protein 1 isoform X18 [Pipistrellus kuhlii]